MPTLGLFAGFKRAIKQVFLFFILSVLAQWAYTQVPRTTNKSTSKIPEKEVKYTTDSKVLAKGQQLFQNNCSACHNFLQKGIGPSLEKATSDLPADWLKKFIQNAPEMISGGDARASVLFEEYKQTMPAFKSLKSTDIDAILSFINSNQKVLSTKDDYIGIEIKDPIPAKIALSKWKLQLQHYTTAPTTAQKAPLARINKMGVLPGEKERVFTVDLRGILYEITDKEWRMVLDMKKERPNFIPLPGLATGFGSFAFHPEFYQNGLLYTTHTEKANTAKADFSYADSIKVTLQWVLTEWKWDNPSDTSFSGKGRELFRINMVSAIHGVQEIAFNPLAKKGTEDFGLLYIGIGDGGATENGYYQLCSNQSKAWGTVLRIDPQGQNSRNGHYGIPKTNPFFQDTNPSTLKEIYCRGFRNPNRITWTPEGTMLISDIGQTHIEELNIGVAGADYGWPEREGTFVINHRGKMDKVYALPTDEAPLKYTYPVIQYDHDEGKAFSGGFVYEGTAIPQLRGKYIFGDINNGRIFCVENNQLKLGKQAPIQELGLLIDNENTTFQKINGKEKPDPRLGVGVGGELFIFTKADGKVYKVVGVSTK